MPTIPMFYGIIIRMYYAPSEHNPPHFHAYYNEYKVTIVLDTLEILEGGLLKKQLRLVQAWAELHIDELRASSVDHNFVSKGWTWTSMKEMAP
jgi:hypothetical protein